MQSRPADGPIGEQVQETLSFRAPEALPPESDARRVDSIFCFLIYVSNHRDLL